MHGQLQVTDGPARGTVLEVKEEPGLGMTVNAIIYDGVLNKGDIVVLGGKGNPIVTKVRAVLLPKPLDEIRDPREQFSSVQMASAASGIKLVAPNLEEAIAGAPLYVVPLGESTDKYVKLVSEEVEKLRIATDVDGIVLKTDTLGSLEAIAQILKEKSIPIRLADVGDVSKRDVIEASIVKGHEALYGAILAFNVKVLPDAQEEGRNRAVQIFQHNIIYHVIENYTQWMEDEQETRILKEFEKIVRPGKLKMIPGYVFRKTKPAIFGVEVLAGSIRPKHQLVGSEGQDLGEILQIQEKGKAITEAVAGMQVAVSLEKPIVGRHINENEVLYVKVPEAHAKAMVARFQTRLSSDEFDALKEFINVMRKKTPFWAA
jgi:translation initiation factor 5B